MIDLSGVRPVGLSQVHYDLDAVVAGLRASAASWVPSHFRNGRRMGDELRLANIRGDKPRKQGSCVIALEGERAGDWIDFEDNQGGGPLSTLEHATGLTGRALIEYAAELAGSAPVNGASHPIAESLTKEQRADSTAREIELILARTLPLGGTVGEIYLAGRGLQVPDTPDLLFHPDLTYWDTRTGYPALIAIVRNAAGEQIAIHRTYLAPDGSGKADVPKPRMMLGSVAGGAVRLGAVGEHGVVGLGEGIETAQHDAGVPGAAGLGGACLGQSGAGGASRPTSSASWSSPTMMARVQASGRRERAAERLGAEGRRLDRPPTGPRARTSTTCCSARAVSWSASGRGRHRMAARATAAGESARGRPRVGTHRPIGFRPPEPPLPLMRADAGDLARLTDRSWSLLFAANAPPWLYRSGGGPAWSSAILTAARRCGR